MKPIKILAAGADHLNIDLETIVKNTNLKTLSKRKLLTATLSLSSMLFVGCHGEEDSFSNKGHNGRNRPTPTATATETPTPTPTNNQNSNGDLRLLDSKTGIQRDTRQQGNLTIETEQGSPLDSTLLSQDGSLELTVRGASTRK